MEELAENVQGGTLNENSKHDVRKPTHKPHASENTSQHVEKREQDTKRSTESMDETFNDIEDEVRKLKKQMLNLQKFKMPQMESHNEHGDPAQHLKTFRSWMELHKLLEAVMCMTFSLTLTKSARQWYRRLVSGSIRNQLKDSLKTPEEERYSGKITRHDHFDDLTDIDNALNKVPEHLAVEERRWYTESCFGHLLRMDRGMKFSAGIVHRLLIRELHHDKPENEMRFMLGRHLVRFSKVEFCLITGLKFGELPDTSNYDMVENGIHQRYFEGRDEVEYAELKAVLRIGVFSEQYDAVKLCLLYMLNWILMGLDEREKVPVWQFRLVEDLDAFDAFPWGAHVYRRSIYGFKHALDGRRRRFEQRQRGKGDDEHIWANARPIDICFRGYPRAWQQWIWEAEGNRALPPNSKMGVEYATEGGEVE
ncbi:hypothetical protein QYF36_015560 [Acer negundo]|nr:hypothetical protein QYF36_015560 [Acer negundo]